jgi:hypothetical protein
LSASVYFVISGIVSALSNAVRPVGLLLLAAIAVFYFCLVHENSGFRNSFNNSFGSNFSNSFNNRFRNDLLKKLSLYSAFAAAYFLTFFIINGSISGTINSEAARSPIGYNTYVGANLNYKGVWNAEDASLLNKLLEDTSVKAQDIHDILFTAALERYKSQGSENIRLLLDKQKMLWLLDNDILWYIISAPDKSNPSYINLDKYFDNFSLAANFYYYVMLLLCLFNSVLLIKSCNEKGILMPVIFILGMMGIHLVVEVSGRYHFPAIALFSLVAAYGLCPREKTYTLFS